jgi:hypothetical protein
VKRSGRLATYVATGVVTGLLLALLAIQLVTRSSWGMQKVRGIALGWLTDRVQGDVRIGDITGGGLLGGAILHDVSITGENGRPFFRVDSAAVSYNWRSLAAGDIALTHVTLFSPHVHLEQLPGDTAWNYQYIFEDTTSGPQQPGARRLIVFDDVRIVDGFATVLLPVEPPIEASDTARLITQHVNGGVGRIMHFDSLQGRLNRVLWESPLETGRLFDVQDISGLAYVWHEPMDVRSARGKLTMRDTIVSLDFPDVRLPSSRGAVMGRVVMEEGRNLFDIQIDLDSFSFQDMDWLYARLPDEGGGRGQLRIQSQPRGTLFYASNASLTTPGTKLAGELGIVVGDTLYFTTVDLRATPLDVDVISRMLPDGLPVDGILAGTVEVKSGNQD